MAYPIIRLLLSKYLRGRIIELQGEENVLAPGATLFVSNHVGWHDPALNIFNIVTHSGNRKVFSLALWPIFKAPGIRQWTATIPLQKEKSKSLDGAIEKLRAGENVLIYPEGEVGHTDTIVNAKTGAARLALLTKCRVVPIGLHRIGPDTVGTWQKAKEIFTGKIKIRIGNPVDLSRWYDQEITKELLHEVADVIMTEVARLAQKKYIRT